MSISNSVHLEGIFSQSHNVKQKALKRQIRNNGTSWSWPRKTMLSSHSLNIKSLYNTNSEQNLAIYVTPSKAWCYITGFFPISKLTDIFTFLETIHRSYITQDLGWGTGGMGGCCQMMRTWHYIDLSTLTILEKAIFLSKISNQKPLPQY